MKAELIDHMGNDMTVVQAARVSFAKDVIEYDEMEGHHVYPKDEKLIAYLAKHHHWTPFAHTAITLRMSAPVPIRTQCFKHKQGFVENEESRRYIKSTPRVYFPDVWRKAPEEGKEKQGSGEPLPFRQATSVAQAYRVLTRDAITTYEMMIASGVCPEQARLVLPQGCIVNWYWTGSLSAFARFYKQRTDSHAQLEIHTLAHQVGSLIAPLFPVSWKELTK